MEKVETNGMEVSDNAINVVMDNFQNKLIEKKVMKQVNPYSSGKGIKDFEGTVSKYFVKSDKRVDDQLMKDENTKSRTRITVSREKRRVTNHKDPEVPDP